MEQTALLLHPKMMKLIDRIKDKSKAYFVVKSLFDLVSNDIELNRDILEIDNNIDDERILSIFDAFEDELISSKDRFIDSVEKGKLSKLKPLNGYNWKDFKIGTQKIVKEHPQDKLSILKRAIEKDIEKEKEFIAYDEFISEYGDKKTNNIYNLYVNVVTNGLHRVNDKKPSQPKVKIKVIDPQDVLKALGSSPFEFNGKDYNYNNGKLNALDSQANETPIQDDKEKKLLWDYIVKCYNDGTEIN